MRTRLTYKQLNQYTLVTDTMLAQDKIVFATINLVNYLYTINGVDDNEPIVTKPFDTLAKAKVMIKNDLKNLGVPFDSEIRRRGLDT